MLESNQIVLLFVLGFITLVTLTLSVTFAVLGDMDLASKTAGGGAVAGGLFTLMHYGKEVI